MSRTYWAALSSLLVASSVFGGDILDANFPANHTIFVNDATNLSAITSMAWAPDNSNRLFVTRKDGQLRIIQNGTLLATPFATVSVYTNSECGLLSVCFDPNYATNKFVYVFRTLSASEQQIVRFTDTNNVGQNLTVIVPGLPTAGQNHDGGGISVGPDGKLYWAIGDNGNGTGVNADMASLAAKVGRANLDGTVPADNPFVDGAGPNNDYIWARGVRNPFTHTWQPSTGKLWVNVVGTNWEQTFIVSRGDHCGYNNYENNQPTGFITPVIAYSTNSSVSANRTIASVSRSGNVATYTTTNAHMFRTGGSITISGVANGTFNGVFHVASTPSDTTFTVAQSQPDATDNSGGSIVPLAVGGCITGGAFYDSTLFAPQYRGNFFFGDYNSGNLQRVVLDTNNTITSVDIFAVNLGKMIDVNVGPDGALYYARHTGTIYRLVPSAPAQGIVVTPANLSVAEGGTGMYAVRLASAPTSDVVVSVARSAGRTGLSAPAGTLTFTAANFSTPQYVTISAALDEDTTNDAATFTFSASGGIASQDANAVTIDDGAHSPTPTAPVITSAVQASVNPAVAAANVTFSAAAENGSSLTWLWDFGDGSSSNANGSVAHAFTNPGTYTVSLTVTNASMLSSSSTLSLQVVAASDADTDGDGIKNDVDPDSDNDGVSNQMELLMGTDPLNAQSVNKGTLSVSKVQGSAKFGASGHDTYALSGSFPNLPALFDPSGKTVIVNLSGALVSFTLDTKGHAKNENGTFTLHLKKTHNRSTKKSEFIGGAGPFKAGLKGGTWSDDWLPLGFDPTVAKSKLTFAAEVALDGVVYVASVSADYASQKAKSARFKSPRPAK